jgi:hypothetical protein
MREYKILVKGNLYGRAINGVVHNSACPDTFFSETTIEEIKEQFDKSEGYELKKVFLLTEEELEILKYEAYKQGVFDSDNDAADEAMEKQLNND